MGPSARDRLPSGERRRWFYALGAVATLALALAPSAFAMSLGPYAQRNLVSDVPGQAKLLDSNLVNAWGLAFGPNTPAWVADNGTDVSTLYSGAVGGNPITKLPLTVSIPGGAPTGMVYNDTSGFVVHSGSSSEPAMLLFSSEAGKITGWNQEVPPPPFSTQAQTAVSVPGAIFKGLAIAKTANGPQLMPPTSITTGSTCGIRVSCRCTIPARSTIHPFLAITRRSGSRA